MTSSTLNKDSIRLHLVTNENNNSFVGIKIKEDKIDLYYPETYDISSLDNISEFRQDVLDLLKTINLAKTKSNLKNNTNSNISNNETFTLISYLWLINDYLVNGLYVNREKVYKENQRGKINWRRTLSGEPIISNGNIIYNNIVVETINKEDNIMVDIYKLCVRRSLEIIGWLYNLSPKIIETKPFNKALKKLYIYTLKGELDKTFEDYKKMRLTHMLKVLTGIDENTYEKEWVYGVDSYYYIFEQMIDHIFSTEKDISKFNPSASWNLVKNNKSIESSKLRPDTIMIDRDNNIAYILDSKYYRFGSTAKEEDLPETTSIQKQITYGDFIEKNNLQDIKEIRNAFILPYNKNKNDLNCSNILEYIGYAETSWRNQNKTHEVIYSFLIDLKYVIKTWNKNIHQEDTNKLMNMIEHNLIMNNA